MISVTTFDRNIVNNNNEDDHSKDKHGNATEGEGECVNKKTTRVSNTAIPKEGNTRRYYHPSEEEFQRDLEQYVSGAFAVNEKRKRWSCLHSLRPDFISVGRVNVTLKFCSACYDVGKKGYKSDLYYIDLNDKTRYRTVLCRGCLGILIKPNKCNSRITRKEIVPVQILTDADVHCNDDSVKTQLPSSSCSSGYS